MPKLRVSLLPALFPALAFALLWSPSAGASPLVALEGTLHERDRFPGLVPHDLAGIFLPAQLPSGRFSFFAGADLRRDPQAAVLQTDAGGWLVALAPESVRLLAPPRRDPESGRTLRPDAPEGAVCVTGDEPDCWRPGDPPLGVEDVVDALCAAVGAGPVAPEAANSEAVDPEPEPEPVGCRFREHLAEAPVPVVSFFGDAVLPPTLDSQSGLDLLNADAGVLMQSIAGFPGSFTSGVSLSGARVFSSGNTSGGFDDGQLVIPTDFSVSAGQQFASELAAISFNFQMLLVALSRGDGSASNAPAEFDPDAQFSMSPGQCSFVQPQFCSSIQALFTTQEGRLQSLPDDPFVTPHERWIWEAGAELEITAAGGALGRFAGGKLFALGPERARIGDPATDIGVTFLLVSDDPAETPQLFFAAPEPEGAALAGAALATLVALSQRRRAHR